MLSLFHLLEDLKERLWRRNTASAVWSTEKVDLSDYGSRGNATVRNYLHQVICLPQYLLVSQLYRQLGGCPFICDWRQRKEKVQSKWLYYQSNDSEDAHTTSAYIHPIRLRVNPWPHGWGMKSVVRHPNSLYAKLMDFYYIFLKRRRMEEKRRKERGIIEDT